MKIRRASVRKCLAPSSELDGERLAHDCLTAPYGSHDASFAVALAVLPPRLEGAKHWLTCGISDSVSDYRRFRILAADFLCWAHETRVMRCPLSGR